MEPKLLICTTTMTIVNELFQYDFMTRALFAGLIVGAIAPLIGIFLVVRRYSLLADTLSHVSLVGVSIAVIIGINPIFGALSAAVLAAYLMEQLRTSTRILGESVLAIFLSGSLAIAVVLIGLSRGNNVNLMSFLFGSITTVTNQDLIIISIFGTLVIGLIALLYRPLFLIAHDEELAKVNGLKVSHYNLLLIVLAAITVSLAMRIVGILLIGALMVIPIVTATLYGQGFKKTLFMGITLSLLAVVFGLITSFVYDLASGGTIVIAALALFIVSYIINRK